MDRVLVYGTLKQGHGNNRLLAGCHLLGEYVTLQTFTMYNSGFPVTFYKTKGHNVLGELYEIPEEQLAATIQRLDQLESEGNMYSRETVRALPLGDSSRSTEPPAVETYMYVGIEEFWRSHRMDASHFMQPNEAGFLHW